MQDATTGTRNNAQVLPPVIDIKNVDTSRISLWNDTQSTIKKLQDSLQMPIITLYIPSGARITMTDVTNLYYHLEKIGKQEKIALFLYGPGGSGAASYRLIKLIRQYTKFLVAVVPDKAASAMTMLSLGANVILVGPMTTFSAIDSSIADSQLAPLDKLGNPVSVEITQVGKFLELMNSSKYTSNDFSKTPEAALVEKVHPLLLGSIQRAFSLSKKLTASILKTHFSDEEKIMRLVDHLNDEYPTHGYPVLPEDIREFGINTLEMSNIQNRLCRDLLDNYEILCDGGSKVDGARKVSWSRQAIIESIGLRTYYYSSKVYTLAEKNEWIRTDSTGKYMHAAMLKTKQGVYRIDELNRKQLSELMNNKEVRSMD